MSDIKVRLEKLEQKMKLLVARAGLLGSRPDSPLPVRLEPVAYLEAIKGRCFCLDCGMPGDLTEEELEELAIIDLEDLSAAPVGEELSCEKCGRKWPRYEPAESLPE